MAKATEAKDKKSLIVIVSTCGVGVVWNRCMVSLQGRCPEMHPDIAKMCECPLRQMAMGYDDE